MAASNISGLVSGMDSNAIIDALKGVKEIQTAETGIPKSRESRVRFRRLEPSSPE